MSGPGRMTDPEAQVLHLSWQPEMGDYAEAFGARNRARKAWHKIGAIAGSALVIALVLLAAGTGSSLVPVLLFAAFATPVMALVIQPVSVRSFWRRNPALAHPLRAQVDPATGITLSGQSTGHHPWPTIHSFLETDRVFVIQLAGYHKLAFLLLAKRGLPSDQAAGELRAALSLGIAKPGSPPMT